MQLFQPFEEFIPLLTFFLTPMGLSFSAGSFLLGRKHAVTFYLLTHFLLFHIPVATVLYLLFSSKVASSRSLSPSSHPVSLRPPHHWCRLLGWWWPSPSGHLKSSSLECRAAPNLCLHPSAPPWLPGPPSPAFPPSEAVSSPSPWLVSPPDLLSSALTL